MGRGLVDETSREISLDSANQVMIFRMGSLTLVSRQFFDCQK